MSKKKEKVIFVLADDDLHARVSLAADIATEGNLSRLTRDALNEKLERLAKRYPQHKDELTPVAA